MVYRERTDATREPTVVPRYETSATFEAVKPPPKDFSEKLSRLNRSYVSPGSWLFLRSGFSALGQIYA